MALLLNIETATERCSACIARDGVLLSLQESTETFSHASQLTLLITAALEAADLTIDQLEAVAVSSGPGSYTGLRIGSATAKGICYALDLPLISISTLQSLALASQHNNEITPTLYAPMIDARRMEVYTALYDSTNQEKMEMQAMILTESSFQSYFEEGYTIVLSGNGAEKSHPLLHQQPVVYRSVECSAAHLVPLSEAAFRSGRFEDQAYFSPIYLKAPNITKSKNIL